MHRENCSGCLITVDSGTVPAVAREASCVLGRNRSSAPPICLCLDHTAHERPRRLEPFLQGLGPIGGVRLLAGVVGQSLQHTNLRLRRVRYLLEVLALELLAARGAVRDTLGVGFARFPIVEKHPIVLSSGPPELCPDLGPLLARTI